MQKGHIAAELDERQADDGGRPCGRYQIELGRPNNYSSRNSFLRQGQLQLQVQSAETFQEKLEQECRKQKVVQEGGVLGGRQRGQRMGGPKCPSTMDMAMHVLVLA